MGFCLCLQKKHYIFSGLTFQSLDNLHLKPNSIWLDDDLRGQNIEQKNFSKCERLIFGDLICEGNFEELELKDWVQSAKGNFICISIFHTKLEIVSSMFGILPIFYEEFDDKIFISDRIEYLYIANDVNRELSLVHILERHLFNYTVTNRSIYESIKQFPVNTFFRFENTSYSFVQHTDIFSLYCKEPKSLGISKIELVDLFCAQVRRYLPDCEYAAAFTGGFDGRCIVAASLNEKKSFKSFSFGSKEASDVIIPFEAAKKQKFSYFNIVLDTNYINNEFENQAIGLVIDSHCMSTISRVHYRYVAQQLSKHFKYLVSGNFGSELFRSAHLDGVMTSKVLFDWIKDGLPNDFELFIEKYPKFNFLDKLVFVDAYKVLKSELDKTRNSFPLIPLQAKLYYFMWSETLRNYFGAELAMQQKYLIHRSPFLDFTFFRRLQESEFSGAYGSFKERNLIKRIKGQLFYAHYLKKFNKGLFFAISGKGYSPSDILNLVGLLKVTFGKLFKSNNPADHDPLLVNLGFKKYFSKWKDNLSSQVKLYRKLPLNDELAMKTIISIDFFVKRYKRF
jgi:hypothetical protein